MRVLVTGATGFLGKTLCSALEARGDSVVRLSSRNCDLTQPLALNAYGDVAYDAIFHLAAWTQADDILLNHPGKQRMTNNQLTRNVHAGWQRRKARAKLIF